jgi:hypothetical protein
MVIAQGEKVTGQWMIQGSFLGKSCMAFTFKRNSLYWVACGLGFMFIGGPATFQKDCLI